MQSPECVRTKEDMNAALTLAKLNPKDISGASQTIFFADDMSEAQNQKFVLLQMNPHLRKCLIEDALVVIKGQPNERAYLCTKDTTFEMFKCETSNSLLLTNNLKFPSTSTQSDDDVHRANVVNILHDFLELQQAQPNFDKLDEMLQSTSYKGPEHEYEVSESDLYTFEQLLSIVQASQVELEKVLDEMKVVSISGKMRVLEFEYHFRVLSYMLKLIEENSWHLDDVSYETTMETLSDLVPIDVLQSVFEQYTVESHIRDGIQLYSYKEVDVCRFFAQVLLHSAGKFNYREFIQAWQDSVPEGMQTREDMLHGIAIVNKQRTPNVVFSFPEKCLPKQIHDRFTALFNAKDKWTVQEITPYITPLTSSMQDVNTLLAKYARLSTVDEVSYYSAKHKNKILVNMNTDYSSEVINGKNRRSVRCKYCNSTILQPENAKFLEQNFDLPTVTQNVKAASATSFEQVTAFWLVEDMFIFYNIGFSNTVANSKFLACADCDAGPLGYHDLVTKLSYVALSRVTHAD